MYSGKKGIYKWYRSESINMVSKSIVHMHIPAEPKPTGFLVQYLC